MTPYIRFYRRDMYNGVYKALYHAFRTEPSEEEAADAVPAPAVLIRMVTDSLTTRLAFIMLATNRQTETFHWVFTYSPVIGHPTEHDGLHYAFVGDYLTAGITVVQVPQAILGRCNATRVYTAATTAATLQDQPLANMLGPYTTKVEGTEVVWSRGGRTTTLYPPCQARMNFASHVTSGVYSESPVQRTRTCSLIFGKNLSRQKRSAATS